MSDPLILHVKGTEQTTALPRHIVRAGIAQGQITRSQLIWSPSHNSWKQVRELPDLWPSQKLAPAPAIQSTGVLPTIASTPAAETPGPGHVPKPRVQTGGFVPAKTTTKPAHKSMVVAEEEGSFGFIKIVCFGVGLLILLLVGANYLLVDQPLITNLSKTPYGKVFVFAHLGAFVQPNAIVIHVPHNEAVTSSNLADFLCNLAASTPVSPGKSTYDSVCLTTGLAAEYKISGFAWKEFGEMKQDDELARKAFLLEQVTDASGQSLGGASGALSDKAQETHSEQAWNTFLKYFTRS